MDATQTPDSTYKSQFHRQYSLEPSKESANALIAHLTQNLKPVFFTGKRGERTVHGIFTEIGIKAYCFSGEKPEIDRKIPLIVYRKLENILITFLTFEESPIDTVMSVLKLETICNISESDFLVKESQFLYYSIEKIVEQIGELQLNTVREFLQTTKRKTIKCLVCNSKVSEKLKYEHIVNIHGHQNYETVEKVAKQLGALGLDTVRKFLKLKLVAEVNESIKETINRECPEIKLVNDNIELLSKLKFSDPGLIDEIRHTLNNIQSYRFNLFLNVELNQQANNLIKNSLATQILLFENYKLNNSQLISRGEYKSKNCSNYYLTWADIKFLHNSIVFDPIKQYKIHITGVSSVLNRIRIDFFQRNYPSEVYKIVVCNGAVDERLSTGLDRLLSVFYHKVESIKTLDSGIYTNNGGVLTLVYPGLSRNQILNLIDSQYNNNAYLKSIAKKVGVTSKVFATYELNNDRYEEVIVFVIQHSSKWVVIWENIIERRATYIFYINDANSYKLDLLSAYMEQSIYLKRQSLYQNSEITINDISFKYFKL